jgi:hypothetical protein
MKTRMARKSRPGDKCQEKHSKVKAAGNFGKNILDLSDGSE